MGDNKSIAGVKVIHVGLDGGSGADKWINKQWEILKIHIEHYLKKMYKTHDFFYIILLLNFI